MFWLKIVTYLENYDFVFYKKKSEVNLLTFFYSKVDIGFNINIFDCQLFLLFKGKISMAKLISFQ